MKHTNKMYAIAFMYTLIMVIIMIVSRHVTDKNFITNLVPFLYGLTVFTFFVARKYFLSLDVNTWTYGA